MLLGYAGLENKIRCGLCCFGYRPLYIRTRKVDCVLFVIAPSAHLLHKFQAVKEKQEYEKIVEDVCG